MYIKMPLSLFLTWIVEQYNFNTHAKDRWVHLEMRKAIWGLPQAGILANKLLNGNWPHLGITNASIPPAFGIMKHARSRLCSR
jgi:hypothetical protein